MVLPTLLNCYYTIIIQLQLTASCHIWSYMICIWHDVAIVLRNAFSTSAEAPLLSKHMAYSMTVASQGSVILPSLLPNPNSSCDICRSSMKTAVLRHANGTSNHTLSVVYTVQWPLLATEVQHSLASMATIPQETGDL